MKHRLPLALSQSVHEAGVHRAEQTATFDAQVRTEGNPTCHKGCSHCCYNPVMVSILEGITVFLKLKDQRLWTSSLKAAFQEHRERTQGLALPIWLMSEIPCPLLRSNECFAYDARPMACRITYSMGDPHDCHPHRLAEAPGIVPRKDVLERVFGKESALLERLSTDNHLLPLSTAVLFAEAIVEGDMAIQDFTREIIREWIAS